MSFPSSLRLAQDAVNLAVQEKHVETAKQVLGNGKLLNDFVSRLLDDISNLKAMLRAISIGAPAACAAADVASPAAAVLLQSRKCD